MDNENNLFTYGGMRISQQGKEGLSLLLSDAPKPSDKIITEADLDDLPPVAKRYLRYAGVIGRPRYQIVRLIQEGAMRMAPGKKWLPLRAVEYYTTNKPGFVWFGRINFAPLLGACAVDSYIEGEGRMVVKLMSLFPVVNQKGDEMKRAALLRYLNEMTWFPTAFLNDNISWEQMDDKSVMVKIEDHGLQVEGLLKIDDVGRVVDFIAKRQRLDGKELKLTTWRTPISAYEEFAGLNLPMEGEALYELESGDFSYIRARVSDLEFDPPSVMGRD
jgi:hypothetical protein